MFTNTMPIVSDRLEQLRREASESRMIPTTTRPSLRQHLAAVASLVRAAFPGVDVAQGSVFPATH